MIDVQSSGISYTPSHRNAVNVAPIGAEVNLIAPYLIAINVRVYIPAHAVIRVKGAKIIEDLSQS